MGKYITDFTSGRVAPALVKFATPLFLTSLLQVFYGMVDMIIVGQFSKDSSPYINLAIIVLV